MLTALHTQPSSWRRVCFSIVQHTRHLLRHTWDQCCFAQLSRLHAHMRNHAKARGRVAHTALMTDTKMQISITTNPHSLHFSGWWGKLEPLMRALVKGLEAQVWWEATEKTEFFYSGKRNSWGTSLQLLNRDCGQVEAGLFCQIPSNRTKGNGHKAMSQTLSVFAKLYPSDQENHRHGEIPWYISKPRQTLDLNKNMQLHFIKTISFILQ